MMKQKKIIAYEKYECQYCDCFFFSPNDLMNHVLLTHSEGERNRKDGRRKFAICEDCGVRTGDWVFHHVTYPVTYGLSGIPPVIMVLCRKCHVNYHRDQKTGKIDSIYWR